MFGSVQRSLFLILVPFVAAAPFACGEQASTLGAQDGAPEAKVEAAIEGVTDHAGVERDGPNADVTVSTDGGDADAYGPPSPDSAKFEGCAPYPCAATQICVFYTPNEQRAECDSIPSSCEPVPTCTCVKQAAASWCTILGCSTSGGQVVLTCETPPPP